MNDRAQQRRQRWLEQQKLALEKEKIVLEQKRQRQEQDKFQFEKDKTTVGLYVEDFKARWQELLNF